MRRVLMILALITTLIVASALQPAVAAAPLVSTIHLDTTTESFTMASDERTTILQGLESKVNFYRGRTSWRCVLPPFAFDDPELFLPIKVHMHIDVLIGPAVDGSGGASVLVEVQVPGKKGGGRLGSVSEELLRGDNRGGALRAEAERLLAEVMGKLSPCTPKAKTKGKTTIRSQGLSWDATWEGHDPGARRGWLVLRRHPDNPRVEPHEFSRGENKS